MKVSFCLIAFVLLISSCYLAIMKQDKQIFIDFKNLLNEEQNQKYQKIVKERMMIYFIGMALGIAIGIFYYMKNKNEDYLFCKVIVIIYFIKLGFYYFFPKSPLMLYYLSTKEQTDAWADIYSEMKDRWIKSLIVGFFGYVFLTVALVKK